MTKSSILFIAIGAALLVAGVSVRMMSQAEYDLSFGEMIRGKDDLRTARTLMGLLMPSVAIGMILWGVLAKKRNS